MKQLRSKYKYNILGHLMALIGGVRKRSPGINRVSTYSTSDLLIVGRKPPPRFRRLDLKIPCLYFPLSSFLSLNHEASTCMHAVAAAADRKS